MKGGHLHFHKVITYQLHGINLQTKYKKSPSIFSNKHTKKGLGLNQLFDMKRDLEYTPGSN